MESINSELKVKNTVQNSDTGLGNDFIFLARRKKSFRYLITSIIILTLCLWFSDRYLRFDLDETKYRVALTLENESARPIMRNISKKIFSQPNLLDDSRYLQYLEFLASIEENDAVIKLYQDIYNLDNINSSFLINYACKLYFLGDYGNAQKLLREAQTLPSNNSLLGYLESAMIINPSVVEEETFATGLSIIAKENRSKYPIIFPEPFWHPTLPKNTYSYYLRKTDRLNHCLAPLYKVSADILDKIEMDLKDNKVQNKQVWLEEIFLMGKKIGTSIELSDYYPTLAISIFSLKIQQKVLNLYSEYSNTIKSDILEKGLKKLNQITQLLDKLQKLEEQRKLEFEYSRNNRIKILWLIFSGFIELLLLFFIGKLISYLLKKLKYSTVYQNQTLTKSILFIVSIWVIAIFLLTFYCSYSDSLPLRNNNLISYLWYFLIILPFIIDLALILLKSQDKKVSLDYEDSRYEKGDLNTNPSKTICFISFMKQISGILLGMYTIIICIWFILFRILYLSYPYQLNLIQDKLGWEELNLIKEFLFLLHS